MKFSTLLFVLLFSFGTWGETPSGPPGNDAAGLERPDTATEAEMADLDCCWSKDAFGGPPNRVAGNAATAAGVAKPAAGQPGAQ